MVIENTEQALDDHSYMLDEIKRRGHVTWVPYGWVTRRLIDE